MRPWMIAVLLLASCGGTESPVAQEPTDQLAAEVAQWDMQSSGEGDALVVNDNAGNTVLRLFCPAGEGKLLVNVPGFNPVGSEERLSFGQGGTAEALVADSSGDSERGGVTGEGPVPENLVALLSGRVSASYGAQVSGAHPAPPADLVKAFAYACSDEASDDGNSVPICSEGSAERMSPGAVGESSEVSDCTPRPAASIAPAT